MFVSSLLVTFALLRPNLPTIPPAPALSRNCRNTKNQMNARISSHGTSGSNILTIMLFVGSACTVAVFPTASSTSLVNSQFEEVFTGSDDLNCFTFDAVPTVIGVLNIPLTSSPSITIFSTFCGVALTCCQNALNGIVCVWLLLCLSQTNRSAASATNSSQP